VSEPYRIGRPGRLLRAARVLTGVGAGLSLVGRRSRVASAAAGVSYLAAGVATRFGVFEAGVASARDPKYVVVPQRERLKERAGS
ncbi:MAG: NrfD/PsrC family molybdoenzyme membrane anchor subunit, partial [Streptosporangiales bacterium]